MGGFHSSSHSQTRNLGFARTRQLTQQKGFFYLTGRDCKYRPVIVVNVARIIEADLKEKTFYEVIGYFFEFMV